MPDDGSKGALAQPEAMLLVRQTVLVRLDWLSITPFGRPVHAKYSMLTRCNTADKAPTCCPTGEGENAKCLINIK